MNNTNNLINDIKTFITSSIKIHNYNKSVNRIEYLNLIDRVLKLGKSDFDSIEKFNYFTEIVNHPKRRTERDFLKILLQKNDSLENAPFLFMCNDLKCIINWMN